MTSKLPLPAGILLLGLVPAAALGQTTGAIPLPAPHYGTSEGPIAPAGPSPSVPFVPGRATAVPRPQPLPSVGSPGYYGVPGMPVRRH
jgi:hypothetical protein